MTRVTRRERDWVLADLGPESGLPRFRFQEERREPWGFDGLDARERAALSGDFRPRVLPHARLDAYDRARRPGRVATVQLANEHLAAVVLPELGGRLASLRDLGAGRELLFDNPVFQPANLGIGNAWFAGGVEWNGPLYGHNAHSCRPVFVGVVRTGHGPIVRIYDFDRSLETAWQVDLFLPENEPRLYAHGCVRNPGEAGVELFWWTNVAVAVDRDTRVLAPAAGAIAHRVDHHVRRVPFPLVDGVDGSYPGRLPESRSVFLDMDRAARPWLAWVDADGAGLGHVSTPELAGRKVFTWGDNPGARRWMDFLSQPGEGDYVELQAGLAPTQLQTLNLAPGARVEWTECFTTLDIDPARAHDPDFAAACAAASRALAERAPSSSLANADELLREHADAPVDEVLARGAAWGRLHEERTGTRIGAGLDFAAPFGPKERAWVELVRDGTFGEETLSETPSSWQVSGGWVDALRRSAECAEPTWLHHLHLAVALLEAERDGEAAEACRASIARRPSWLAHRLLALVAERAGLVDEAERSYGEAWSLARGDADLAVELSGFLARHGRGAALQGFVSSLAPHVREHERIDLAAAHTALERGDFAGVRAVLARDFATIREGETTLSDLWTGLHEAEESARLGRALSAGERVALRARHPVPARLDFRVRWLVE